MCATASTIFTMIWEYICHVPFCLLCQFFPYHLQMLTSARLELMIAFPRLCVKTLALWLVYILATAATPTCFKQMLETVMVRAFRQYLYEPGYDKTAIWCENMKIVFSLQTVLRYLNYNCTKFHDDLSFLNGKKFIQLHSCFHYLLCTFSVSPELVPTSRGKTTLFTHDRIL